MMSRGKQLLAIALKKGVDAKGSDEGKVYKVHDYDQNNNTDEFYDYDDNVNDPDFLPPKKKSKKCVPKYLVCHETLSSDSSESDMDDEMGDQESDNTDDYTLPSKVMDPNELLISRPDIARTLIPNTSTDNEMDNATSVTTESLDSSITYNPNNIVDHEEVVGMSKVIEVGIDNVNEDEVLEVMDDNSLRNEIAKATCNVKKQNEQLRMTGLQYKGRKLNDNGKKQYSEDRSERILTQSKCSKRCEKKVAGRRCTEIDNKTRELTFKTFWRILDWKQKRVYVLSLVDKQNVARRTTEEGPAGSRRNCSYKYHLKVNGERLLVCKEMFLSTLGMNEKMVYNWIEKQESSTSIPTNATPLASPMPSMRRKPRHLDAIKCADEYLEILPKLPSHYCRSSSSKKYLEPVFTSMTHLHREYDKKMKEESKPVLGITAFTQLVDKMNIRLFRPKKDLCDICCGHDAKTVSDIDYADHIKRKNEARNAKDTDKERTSTEENIKVVTVDLQSLLICPNLNASCIYYKMKLSCHNYTIFDLRTRKVMNYFWHECDGELNANVFTTCITDYRNENIEGIDTLIIYSDGCGYQNRNVTLSNGLMKLAMDNNITIEQKYLERGHTQMECDSVHSVIERSVKKQPAIYVPQQYVDAIRTARKTSPYEVKYVDYSFFMDYSKVGEYSSIRPGIGTGSTTVNDIRCLRYNADGTVMYKTAHTGSYEHLPKPRKKADPDAGSITQLYKKQQPLKQTKFQHLQQLKMVIPRDYHSFYDNLPRS